MPYGLGVHLELALLAHAGILNDQVLRMATAGGAIALGLERDLRHFEEGKLADFVVVDGDPLAHIDDTLKISRRRQRRRLARAVGVDRRAVMSGDFTCEPPIGVELVRSDANLRSHAKQMVTSRHSSETRAC